MAKMPPPDRKSDCGYGAGISCSMIWIVRSLESKQLGTPRGCARNYGAVTTCRWTGIPQALGNTQHLVLSDILVMPDRLAPARPIVYRCH